MNTNNKFEPFELYTSKRQCEFMLIKIVERVFTTKYIESVSNIIDSNNYGRKVIEVQPLLNFEPLKQMKTKNGDS